MTYIAVTDWLVISPKFISSIERRNFDDETNDFLIFMRSGECHRVPIEAGEAFFRTMGFTAEYFSKFKASDHW